MTSIAAFQRRLVGVNQQRIAWSPRDVLRIAQHMGVDANLAELPPMLSQRRHSELVLKDGTSADARTFHFTASTGEVDRMGDTLSPSGWRLDQFRKNPVVLAFHDAQSLPVAKAVAASVVNNRLSVSIKFASTRFAKTIAEMVSQKFLAAVSVGFQPLTWAFSNDPARKSGIDFTAQELLEISIVPIPANPSCLLQGISGGADGKAVAAKRKRAREIEILRLRAGPLTRREQRAVDVARLRRG
jgi:HK97 family phage prohead protease